MPSPHTTIFTPARNWRMKAEVRLEGGDDDVPPPRSCLILVTSAEVRLAQA